MQVRTSFIFLGAILIAATPASADGFYADGGFSATAVNADDAIDPVLDPNFKSLGGHIGVGVSKFISIEGEALIGLDSELRFGSVTRSSFGEDAEQTQLTDIQTDVNLNYIIGGFARGTVPVTSKLNVFGRLGYAQAEIDSDTTVREINLETEEVSISYTGSNIDVVSGPAFGVGATYDVSDKVYIRGDFTRYDLDDGELDNIMIGAGIRF